MSPKFQRVGQAALRPAAAALCLLVVCSAQPSAAQPAFSFRQAEFMNEDAALRSATAFVADELPAGLAVPEALARLKRADMDCRPDASGVTACSFGMVEGRDGGTLGEDTWTVRLRRDPQDRITAADLSHQQTGFAA